MAAGRPRSRIKNNGSTRRAAYNTRKNGQELERAGTIDELAVYDDLFTGALASLKKDIANGMGAIDIAKKYANLAQARIVTTALTDQDSSKALAASQDIINRAHGRPTEKREVKHALADSSDSELDAVITSKMALLEEADDEGVKDDDDKSE